MNEQISIIGLGWLGLPLAKYLLKKGYLIKGSTTSDEKLITLKQNGIDVFKVLIDENGIEGTIENCIEGSDILIITIPPGLRHNPESNYVQKIENLINYVEKSSLSKVLFISSTSVFSVGENFPVITNETEPNSNTVAGLQISKIEKQLLNNANFSTTILRFAGLIDETRHPVTMLTKKKNILNPKAPINLIHLNDCIEICSEIIEQQKWNKIYNAAYPFHPQKSEYYKKQALKRGLNEPSFDFSKESKGKFIDGKQTAESLQYSYKYLVEL